MSNVTLADAKAHLRITFAADDAYITGIIEAAEDYIARTGVEFSTPLPAAIRHAVLLTVSHFYNNREAVTAETLNAMPFGVNALLQPYREQGL